MQERTKHGRRREAAATLAVIAVALLLWDCGVGGKVLEERSVPASPPPASSRASEPPPVAPPTVHVPESREPIAVPPPSQPRRQEAVPAPEALPPSLEEAPDPEPLPDAAGVVHVVHPGETLWSISRTYGHTVVGLAEVNGLENVHFIETGQELFVPGATRVLEVPVVPMNGIVDDGLVLAWPVPRRVVLSRFGEPRRTYHHKGLDLRGRRGEPVTASAGGTVTYSGWMRGYGKVVILDHGSGLETLYAHNSELLVEVGETVAQGQIVARVGRTGNATAAHCHFEVRRDGVAMDPMRYLSRDVADRR